MFCMVRFGKMYSHNPSDLQVSVLRGSERDIPTIQVICRSLFSVKLRAGLKAVRDEKDIFKG